MVTVVTRTRQISDREGFDIVVTKGKKSVSVTRNGVLGSYGFTKKMKNAKTVKDWRTERFEKTYPGYSCKVLKGDGKQAAGNMLLETVRESYETD